MEAGKTLPPPPPPQHRLPGCLERSWQRATSWDISFLLQAAPCAQGWSCQGTGQHPPHIPSDGRMPGQRHEGKLVMCLRLEAGSWQEQRGRPFRGVTWVLRVLFVSFGGYHLCAGSLLRAAVRCPIFPVMCLSPSLWTLDQDRS